MREIFSDAALRLCGQPMFQLLDRVRAMEQSGRDIVHFEIGDPQFDTPPAVVEQCVQALRRGETHYSSSFGLPELREAIAQYTSRDLGFTPQIDQVLVSPGTNALIYFVLQCLVRPGEEVLVPDPAFSTYFSVLNFLNIKAVRIPLREENDFRMSPLDIRRRISPRTKLIILNSPQNPTGAVLTDGEVQEIYELAEAQGAFILSDEIYRLMTYEDRLPASVTVYDHCLKRTILMAGFSKAFAMTGWRLGYMIAPPALTQRVGLLLETIVSCVPPFIQEAGITVLEHACEYAAEMTGQLRVRRDAMVAGLNRLPGVRCLTPPGAFYVFPNIQGTGLTSEEFSELMLQEAGVALLPGPNFGEQGQGYVRLCFACSLERIEEGLKRLEQVLQKRCPVVVQP